MAQNPEGLRSKWAAWFKKRSTWAAWFNLPMTERHMTPSEREIVDRWCLEKSGRQLTAKDFECVYPTNPLLAKLNAIEFDGEPDDWIDFPTLARLTGESESWLEEAHADGRGPPYAMQDGLIVHQRKDVLWWVVSQHLAGV